ncbi:MAG: HEPN domain-containing protein [Thermodesulfovibrionales bacterium]|nr:HEPN domain-containing protein [Thermodesulfovibrionales bacterium]
MDEKVAYWLELAEYDIETARVMLEAKRFLYVGFMCHQAIEKTLKAYYQQLKNELPIKTHNLRLLCEETGLDNALSDEQKRFLRVLEPMNIEARYPEYKERLFKSLSYERCLEILEKTKGLQTWIKELLFTRQKNIQN